jgi:methyltransferase (TIGR00027 family)
MTRLYEVDVADIFAFKEPVLRAVGVPARCDRVVVSRDLRDDWPRALRESGLDVAQPTAWLLEGLLMYLAEVDRERLLGRIDGLSAPGSRLALEPAGWTIPPDLAPNAAIGRVTEAVVQSLAGADHAAAAAEASVGDPAAWLAAHGWCAHVQPAKEVFTSFDRPVPPLLEHLRRFLATAKRADKSFT